jgi:hypothetical protein
MHNDDTSAAPEASDTDAGEAARTDASRQRFHRARAFVARAPAAGGKPPGDAEAARLVAEFHARGGRTTMCPPAEDAPLGDVVRGGGKPGRRARA